MSAALRCYTVPQLLAALQMSRTTFKRLLHEGKLPFLEELKPRAGRPRYRADLVDKYLAGEWARPSLAFGGRRAR
jgi:predicted DNA-binding transcriptional regulator AlpA